MSKNTVRRATGAHYQKVVFWSEDDACFIGQCPSLFLGGVHGNDEQQVYADLCKVVNEHLDYMYSEGKDAPAVDLHAYSGKLTLRIKPAIHRALALRASAIGDSLTGHIERTLVRSLS